MDIIFISDLRIETIIGIYDWERKVRQTVSLDLEMAADIRKAAATDSIEDTLNYKAVAKRLIEFVGDSEFQLVETLAENDRVRYTISTAARREALQLLLAENHARAAAEATSGAPSRKKKSRKKVVDAGPDLFGGNS